MAAFTPDSDNLIYQHFTATSFRYWRIIFTGLDVFAAIAVLGTRFTFDSQIEGEYIPAVDRPKNIIEVTRNGDVTASTTMVRSLECGLRIGFMLDTSFNSTFKAAWDAHLSLCKPFFFASDYTNNPRDVFFYRIKSGSEVQAGYNMQNRRAVVLPMVGAADMGNGYAAQSYTHICSQGTWVLRTNFTAGPNTLRGIAWAVDRWVAVGESTPFALVLLSTDSGATWTRPSLGAPVQTNFKDITLSGSTLIAVGSAQPFASLTRGVIYISTDSGTTWSLQLDAGAAESGKFEAVTEFAGNLYADGSTGSSGTTHGLFKSADGGVAWVLVTTRYSSPGISYVLTNSATEVVSLGTTVSGGNDNFSTSTDGAVWVVTTNPRLASRGLIYDCDYNGSLYCAVGGGGSSSGVSATILTSTDGSTWVENTTHPFKNDINCVLWAGGCWWVSGYDSVYGGLYIAFTNDLSTWVVDTMPVGFTSAIGNFISALGFNGTQLCAVGNYSSSSAGPIIMTRDI